nr:MAG TPA: hypothetical protein [Caudoviricetes sp.]
MYCILTNKLTMEFSIFKVVQYGQQIQKPYCT